MTSSAEHAVSGSESGTGDEGCPCGATVTEAHSPDCADVCTQEEAEHWGYEQVLRADRAELALRDADRKLALLLQVCDALERDGEKGIRSNMVALAIRRMIRGIEFAP